MDFLTSEVLGSTYGNLMTSTKCKLVCLRNEASQFLITIRLSEQDDNLLISVNPS